MKVNIEKLKNRFEQFSMREKLIVSLSVTVVSFAAWHTLLFDYALASETELANRSKLIRQQITQLEQQIDSVSGIVGRDTTPELAKQADLLKKEGLSLENKIVEETKRMVSHKEMNRVLRYVIQKSEGLTLLGIESLERTALFENKLDAQGQKTETPAQQPIIPGKKWQIYNHGLKVEMLGGYFETLNFLKELEKQHLSLIWDEISYEVVDYPNAKIKIIVHTLSLDEGWIGV